MKILLVGPGIMPIPPIGWGAVESLIWDYNLELQAQGHEIEIINIPDRNEIIEKCNNGTYDFIHIHYDVFFDIIPNLKHKHIALSSHYPYVDQLDKHFADGYDKIFRFMVKQSKKGLNIFAISRKDMETFLEYGADKNRVFLMENGANPKHFAFREECEWKDKSVYLGKIEKRKRQYMFQSIPNIDFIGKYHSTEFDVTNPNYLGEITPRERLFEDLTKYANMVLLSDGENGSPLVIKEALCAGLGIVVSEFAASELDRTKPFITVIEESKINDLQYIQSKIEENRKVSIGLRKEIKKYFEENFSWSTLIQTYVSNIEKIIKS